MTQRGTSERLQHSGRFFLFFFFFSRETRPAPAEPITAACYFPCCQLAVTHTPAVPRSSARPSFYSGPAASLCCEGQLPQLTSIFGKLLRSMQVIPDPSVQSDGPSLRRPGQS